MTAAERPRPLDGRCALVTGGSRGVGAAISRRLAADGAYVAINYRRDADAAAQVVDGIRAGGGEARAFQASVDDPDEVAAMIDALRAERGDVDLLVSNAGIASRGRTVEETDRAEYLRLLSVHVLGLVELLRLVLFGMRRAARGDVIAVSSVVADTTPPGTAPYAMAKGALEALMRTLALEERPAGIRVNVVAPGLVSTDMGDRLVRGAVGQTAASELDAHYPFGRVCRPEDVAAAVAFLASSDAGYITRQRLVVDGGGTHVPLVVPGH